MFVCSCVPSVGVVIASDRPETRRSTPPLHKISLARRWQIVWQRFPGPHMKCSVRCLLHCTTAVQYPRHPTRCAAAAVTGGCSVVSKLKPNLYQVLANTFAEEYQTVQPRHGRQPRIVLDVSRHLLCFWHQRSNICEDIHSPLRSR